MVTLRERICIPTPDSLPKHMRYAHAARTAVSRQPSAVGSRYGTYFIQACPLADSCSRSVAKGL
ncbi:MAG: hypothetical protein F6K26_53360 [Moorea sp. SIO2I5]|nr:hypothetical protein [Moorena sp. SIO2I5]